MIALAGQSVGEGIVFGKISVLSRKKKMIRRIHINNSDTEIMRFENAVGIASAELGLLYDKAKDLVGKPNAMIFQIHQMMLEDIDYNTAIKDIISDQMINAEAAVAQTCDTFVKLFDSMDDGYMRERSADIKDISERLIRILSGTKQGIFPNTEPAIIAADNLAPSEIVQIDRKKHLAFITENGSKTSHTSILAAKMNIPGIVGVGKFPDGIDGKTVIADGFSGKVYIAPDEKTIIKFGLS